MVPSFFDQSCKLATKKRMLWRCSFFEIWTWGRIGYRESSEYVVSKYSVRDDAQFWIYPQIHEIHRTNIIVSIWNYEDFEISTSVYFEVHYVFLAQKQRTPRTSCNIASNTDRKAIWCWNEKVNIHKSVIYKPSSNAFCRMVRDRDVSL